MQTLATYSKVQEKTYMLAQANLSLHHSFPSYPFLTPKSKEMAGISFANETPIPAITSS